MVFMRSNSKTQYHYKGMGQSFDHFMVDILEKGCHMTLIPYLLSHPSNPIEFVEIALNQTDFQSILLRNLMLISYACNIHRIHYRIFKRK